MPPRMVAAASASRRMRTLYSAGWRRRWGRATTSGSGCEAAGRASVGTGAPLRCGSLRSPPLRSAPAPAPETTPREFLFILILLFLALLINYDYWKCLRDIGTEGSCIPASCGLHGVHHSGALSLLFHFHLVLFSTADYISIDDTVY